ncbi:F-box protein At3g56470-like [Andrographis paniculata]|uniref:F-box protein At3g56470-like n=1 Tax=Andrographis paniculata TaxID=175694 RepID=UPI0021E82390|nr:F-box protein At3g56470-like [Andrographis paniculata]
MFIPKSHDLCEFYNPTDRISYYLKVPAMKSNVVYYCKDDWIRYFCLVSRRHFLFHPYSGNTVSFPKLNRNSEVAAFSDTPTSPSCVVFSVTQWWGNTVCISICRPTDKEWKNYEFNVLSQAGQLGFKQIAYYEGSLGKQATNRASKSRIFPGGQINRPKSRMFQTCFWKRYSRA